MGGIGSGRVATHANPVRVASQTAQARVRYAAPVAWSNLKAFLASTRRNLEENPDYVPPSSVLDIHKWVIEQSEGKATARLDLNANVSTEVSVDPSKLVAAMRELESNRSGWLQIERESISDNERCANLDAEYSLVQPQPHACALAPDWEEGCRMADPLRNVSDHSEKILGDESGLNINGGGI